MSAVPIKKLLIRNKTAKLPNACNKNSNQGNSFYDID